MSGINNKKGLSLTLSTVFIAVLMAVFLPAFCMTAFLTENTSRIGTLKQQAYYNANSGVEYALFIIAHRNPLDQASWPNGNQFNCFGDPDKGSVQITITQITPGFSINSTGTFKGVTVTLNDVRVSANKVNQWL